LSTAGKTRVAGLVVVPPSKRGQGFKATDWLSATQLVPVGPQSDDEAYGEYVCAAEKDEFPIKVKDVVNSQAFTYLKNAGLVKDESDDENYDVEEGGDY